MNKMKMIKIITLSFLVFMPAAFATTTGGPFGLGVILGEPSGLSAKIYLSNDRVHAIDGAIGWSLGGSNDFSLMADYLYHNYNIIQVSTGQLPVYFGLGGIARLRDHADDEAGLRVPLGLDYQVATAPIDIFAEIGPVLNVTPDISLGLTGGIGCRYYF